MYTVTGEKLSVKSSTHKGIWSDSWAIKLGLKAKRSSPKLLSAIQLPVGCLLADSFSGELFLTFSKKLQVKKTWLVEAFL